MEECRNILEEKNTKITIIDKAILLITYTKTTKSPDMHCKYHAKNTRVYSEENKLVQYRCTYIIYVLVKTITQSFVI